MGLGKERQDIRRRQKTDSPIPTVDFLSTTMSEPKSNLLTTEEAYNAMYAFLSLFNETYRSDDISNLLHGLSTHTDGQPMEPVHTKNWIKCVEDAKKGKVDTKIRFVK